MIARRFQQMEISWRVLILFLVLLLLGVTTWIVDAQQQEAESSDEDAGDIVDGDDNDKPEPGAPPRKLRDEPPVSIENGTDVSGLVYEGDWITYRLQAPEVRQADVTIHLTAPNGGFVDIFCANNAGVFSFQKVYPIAPFYIWSSNHRAGNDTIFISRMDRNAVFGPGQSYNCIVYGMAHSSVDISSIPFTINYSFTFDDRTISDNDRSGILGLYERCCIPETGACQNWRAAVTNDRERW